MVLIVGMLRLIISGYGFVIKGYALAICLRHRFADSFYQ